MSHETLTPSRFLAGLIGALAVQNVTRLTPEGWDRSGFAGLHRYLQGAVAHDADVGDEDFSRSELDGLAAALTPGDPLRDALRAQIPATLREDDQGGYRITLDIAGGTALLTG